jgi:acyl-CoA synthetase (AMP-forming)/AMP-acid ligase II
MDLHFSPEDRTGTALPLFHVAMFVCSQFSMLTGGTLVLIPQVDPKVIMETIEKEKLTNILLIPPLFRAILYHPEFKKYDLSSLRLLGYFGSVMPEDLIHEVMDKLCPNLYLSFGQTEMSPCVTCFKPEDHLRKIKSLGISTVHCEIAVMDNDGNFLPPGETGEFVYRSPSMMNGYYKKDEDNKKAFEYGWFHSGDLGYLDEDGFVYFVDRKKDMIKSGGENLASIEVEKLIYMNPKVQEVQVVGLPHERWIEAVTAFIIPKPGEKITEEEMIAFCKEKMAGFKVPKRVIFDTELPRNPSGKVLKYKLKEKHKDLYKTAK